MRPSSPSWLFQGAAFGGNVEPRGATYLIVKDLGPKSQFRYGLEAVMVRYLDRLGNMSKRNMILADSQEERWTGSALSFLLTFAFLLPVQGPGTQAGIL